jgi:hypothetical protein
MIDRAALDRLASETGGELARMGVRPSDAEWIRMHAETIASLGVAARPAGRFRRWIYRFARRAARTAR